jgi:hypothetical protein
MKFQFISNSSRIFIFCLTLFCLSACSPKFDWREVRAVDAPIFILLPAKAASHSKEIDLDGIKIKMTMTAADAGQISFALAYAKIDGIEKDSANYQLQQEKMLAAMKSGMLKNINGKILDSNTNITSKTAPDLLQAIGQLKNGQSVKLIAKFTSYGPWVIQAVMIGDEKLFKPEIVDMFFGSLKFN